MPNVLRLKVPAGDDPEIDWAIYVNWRVPIDDGVHDTFGVRYVEASEEVKERYLERRRRLESLPVPPVEDLADKILRGEEDTGMRQGGDGRARSLLLTSIWRTT